MDFDNQGNDLSRAGEGAPQTPATPPVYGSDPAAWQPAPDAGQGAFPELAPVRRGGAGSGNGGRGPSQLATIAGVAILSAALASGGTVGALAVGGAFDKATTGSNAAATTTPTASGAQATTTPVVAGNGSATSIDASAIASAVMPAVVEITTQSTSTGRNPFQQPSASPQTTGVGTGIIFDSNGWIVTNRHVVSGATAGLTVYLQDGRSFTGTVYGTDTLTDLAIVKIQATGLTAATFGDSSTLRVGQPVVAIGNALGEYTDTVTSGIISGLNRTVDVEGSSLTELLQTDAAINPGNSGGPLLDASGRVIGINTAEATSAQGIGFAIPVNLITPITKQALAGQQLSRPWLGIRYLTLDAGIAQKNNLSVDHGAWLTSQSSSGTGSGAAAITSGGPAAAAGLKENDIITAVDGVTIDDYHPFVALLAAHNPGETVTLTVVRAGTSIQIKATLGTRPASISQ